MLATIAFAYLALAPKGLRAYFLPFEALTLNPVGRKGIEEAAWDFSSLVTKRRGELLGLLQAASGSPAPLKDGQVRLKVIDGRKTYFVDYDGVVETNGVGHRLTPRQFYNLKLFFYDVIPHQPSPELPTGSTTPGGSGTGQATTVSRATSPTSR